MPQYVLTNDRGDWNWLINTGAENDAQVKKETEERARQACERFDLMWAFYYVKETNPSNDLPYHNWFHTCSVVAECFEGGQHHQLPYTSFQELLVAALFHDYDHSGGVETDTVNIARAKMRLANATTQAMSLPVGVATLERLKNVASALISVTEYNDRFEIEPVTIEEKILRDADLMMITYQNWFTVTVYNLGKEISVKRGATVPLLDMVRGQIGFIKSARLFTEWGQTKYDNVRRSRIVGLEGMIKQGERKP